MGDRRQRLLDCGGDDGLDLVRRYLDVVAAFAQRHDDAV
jgi:hypothetical protein